MEETWTREIKRKIHSRIFVDYNPDHKNTVLLAGSGRSGTTWVAEIINYRNEFRYIFEPFHPYQVNFFGNSPIRQYLRPGNREGHFIAQVQAILSGRINSRWTNKFNRRFLCHKRLIKAIRANLLLKWMHVNFPGLSIILLLRHPCAVAHSQLTLHAWPWDVDPEQFLAQQDLMQDFLDPFREVMENVQTEFEKHILLWCVENYVPLKQFKRDEIHLAFYENFCQEPEYEIDRLFSFLGKSYGKAVLAELGRPSQVSRKESAIVSGGSLVDSWREKITHEQIETAIAILRTFGLDKIYSRDSMPDVDHAYGMMKPSSNHE